MRCPIALALVAAAIALPSCSGKDASQEHAGKPVVFVSVLPQAYLAERIAGGHVDVEVLVGPGQNPHTYAPTPGQMTRLLQARVFFRAGMPFEETLLPKLGSNKRLRIIDMRKGIALLPDKHEGEADHGPAAAHEAQDEGDMDPHTWLSPRLAKAQARTLGEALAEIDPVHRSDYERNLQRLQADLDAVEAEIASALAPLRGRTFFVFHPAFGYFAQEFGLIQEAVETGGKTPGPKHIKELIDKARQEGIRVIFVEPQFSEQTAKAIAREIGGVVVALDPLSKDYFANLRDVARKIHDALSPPAPAAEGA